MITQKLKTTTFLISLLVFSSVAFGQTRSKTVYKSNDKTHTHKVNTGVTSSELEYRGDIEFTDDDKDIKSISSGGFLYYSKRTFGTKRSLKFESKSNGTFTREYYEGGREKPFDPDGREFMELAIPDIIRSSGIGAKARVARIYRQGGVDAVTNEISNISSNYVSAIYYREAIAIPGMKTDEVAKMVQHAGDDISSSYEMGRLLRDNMDIFLKHPTTTEAMIEAASEMSSDYEQSQVYKAILKEEINDGTVSLVVEGTRNLSSNYEISQVLQKAMSYKLSQKSIELVLDEVMDMSSSYEQSRILVSLIKEQELNSISTEKLLLAASEISSDYEKGNIGKAMIKYRELSAADLEALIEYSNEFSSDYEQSKMLQSLLDENNVTSKTIDIVIEASDNISSNYEQSKLITQALGNSEFKGSNFATVLEATDDISSSYERSRILMAVVKHENLETQHYLPILMAIGDVSSSYERAKLLTAVAPDLPSSKEIEDAFFEAADGLSNHDYGTVMKAFRR